MTAVAPSTIADDLVDLVNQALNFTNAMYAPPEGLPPGKAAWIEYGPVPWIWGLLGEAHPQITITVGVPANGMYPNEYRVVTDMAHDVVQALRNARTGGDPLLLGGEATITQVEQRPAGRISFAGEPGAMMRAEIVIEIETKQE